jgi:hypothetical protein
LLHHIVPVLFPWISLSKVLEKGIAEMMNLSDCFQEEWNYKTRTTVLT